jgi:Arc/MetJ family transcription regulator
MSCAYPAISCIHSRQNKAVLAGVPPHTILRLPIILPAGLLDDAHKRAYIGALPKGGQLMAHTNIDLDEKLLAEAMQLTRARTKKEVIHLGLRELIRLARLRGVREHRGKFHWRGDLEKMREEETHEWRKSSGRYKRSH